MITKQPNCEGNLSDVSYAEYLTRLNAGFLQRCGSGPVFETDASLWDYYLQSFDRGLRQHHNCYTCKQFIRSYGHLATVDVNGRLQSALWLPEESDDVHRHAISMMAMIVNNSKITRPFYTANALLGNRFTGQWQHLSVQTPGQCRIKVTPSARAAEKVEEFGIVGRALHAYPLHVLDQAVSLLESDALFRAEHVLGPVVWLRDLSARVHNKFRHNLIWNAVAQAPAGFCHPTSSMAGSLLEDLASGIPLEQVRSRFATKMDPLRYQRPQAPPKEGNVVRAEKLFEEMGLALSLERRFATLADVQALWLPVPEEERGGLFGHLLPKKQTERELKGVKQITWDKFARTVLPQARKMEIFVPTRGCFVALTTAVHSEAPPILQWDTAEQRNPASWYMYSQPGQASQWNLRSNSWTTVTAVCLSPHMWYGRGSGHHGPGANFLLKGAVDTRTGAGNALFPEEMRSELREVRSVIEAYSKKATLAGRSDASACGLWVGQKGCDGTIRVTDPSGLCLEYEIDRWD